MNYDTFLKFLQSVITMTDINDPESVANSSMLLSNLYRLILSSGMADGGVRQMAAVAAHHSEELLMQREEFAGAPGHFRTNKAKRDRLAMALYPHC